MKVPFVSFLPMEKELDKDLRAAFERVYTRSWYIGGVEDEEFEKAFADALKSKTPFVIDCIIDSDDKVWPMVAPGKPINESFDESE